jgi:type I restriction enzyme S subunit
VTTVWEVKKLGEVLTLEYGKPLPPSERNAIGKYAVYGANGVKDRSNRFYVDRCSIIVGRKGSAGELTLTENKFWPLDVTYFVTFDETKYDLQFLYHLLSLQELTKLAKGVKPGINRNEVYAKSVRVPPLPEQQRIVAILDEAFAGLATATANAEKNLKNARELFESYLNSIFAGKKSGDWVASPIGEIAEVFDGPHATPKTVEAGPVFLGISSLKDGVVDLSETRHVTADDFKKWTRRVKPRPDDVVFSYETRLGQAAIIPKGLECCLGRRMGLVRCDRSKIEPRFLLYQYLAKPLQDFLRSKTVKGATVDRISIKEFPAFEVRIAPLAEQRKIVSELDSFAENCTALEEKYRRKMISVANLKQSILLKAFSGELTPPPEAIKEAAE